VDVQLEKPLTARGVSTALPTTRNAGRLIVLYWAIATLVGVPLLYDWLLAWNVPATLSQPWLVVYLLISFVLSQVLYIVVARHDGRPIHWGALTLFSVGNGLAETFAFAAIYRLGEIAGSAIVGSFAPAGASIAGFILGMIFFTIYGGLIHGLFWLRILPPHLDDNPRSRTIRKFRPLAEVALVLGWSLCFWLFRDIWTVIFLHILVDVGLMVLVRPPIFGASAQPTARR
jgi:chlorophyllide a hydrolase